MSFIGNLVGAVLRPLLERQVKNRSLADLAASLEGSSVAVANRLEAAADTPRNREVANHVVGIERWGQRRLRVALGEVFVPDGYRGYRAPEDASLADLTRAYADTRRTTLELVRELQTQQVDPTRKIRHNDLGELSVKGWLAYLDGHAKRESTRLKA